VTRKAIRQATNSVKGTPLTLEGLGPQFGGNIGSFKNGGSGGEAFFQCKSITTCSSCVSQPQCRWLQCLPVPNSIHNFTGVEIGPIEVLWWESEIDLNFELLNMDDFVSFIFGELTLVLLRINATFSLGSGISCFTSDFQLNSDILNFCSLSTSCAVENFLSQKKAQITASVVVAAGTSGGVGCTFVFALLFYRRRRKRPVLLSYRPVVENDSELYQAPENPLFSSGTA